MSSLSDLIKKAHAAFDNFRGINFFVGKDGEIVYSKNNVCIHDCMKHDKHAPGYLTIQCQNDDQLGITLILQWLPNTTLEKNPARFHFSLHFIVNKEDTNLNIPSINIIPNTPLFFEKNDCDMVRNYNLNCNFVKMKNLVSATNSIPLLRFYYKDDADIYKSSPEQFARTHNLMLDIMFHQKTPAASLFSVNLGNMKSMRLFFSTNDHSSGQLVLANRDSQYKILHFHYGGLDKLAQLLQQWSAIKTKSVKDGSPSAVSEQQLLICQPHVTKMELDPEEGLYDSVGMGFWKSYRSIEGRIDDSYTIRKAIYFASIHPLIRSDVWPFLLRVYPWESTFEQRETIRNDLFLSYQNIRKLGVWINIENSIMKDVIRTDRRNPFYANDSSPNLEIMKNILLNYAIAHPKIGYIQGMSDLLAPILCNIRDESHSYWCFSGLMQQTLFAAVPTDGRTIMDINLDYLRELLALLVPDFFVHLIKLSGDAPHLMFTHRWILLWFKREFSEKDVLRIWEACWARYRTTYFHLFICIAIISVYGEDVIQQSLPHDEILLYFSSLAMHMDANIILKKARGLLYHFYRLEKVPCTLAGICEQEDIEQWNSHVSQRTYQCTKVHGDNEPCPFANDY
ncbi:unnamed protein product [Dracunculus medinensis]|uniref:Rab-GAP TBC domain-containing protein n=1 Tax=Dracunculus medinensis TaxID=318479 RepID=A0A158Q385_DRAME|nr:unnamed protein product [Dracunculus medinensis]